jgi:nucleoside diphosphate kinase
MPPVIGGIAGAGRAGLMPGPQAPAGKDAGTIDNAHALEARGNAAFGSVAPRTSGGEIKILFPDPV